MPHLKLFYLNVQILVPIADHQEPRMPKLQEDQPGKLGHDEQFNQGLDQLENSPAIIEVGTDPVFVREQVIWDGQGNKTSVRVEMALCSFN